MASRRPQTKRYTFTLEAGGKTYECERTVTGTRTLSQTIPRGTVRTAIPSA